MVSAWVMGFEIGLRGGCCCGARAACPACAARAVSLCAVSRKGTRARTVLRVERKPGVRRAAGSALSRAVCAPRFLSNLKFTNKEVECLVKYSTHRWSPRGVNAQRKRSRNQEPRCSGGLAFGQGGPEPRSLPQSSSAHLSAALLLSGRKKPTSLSTILSLYSGSDSSTTPTP